MIQLIDPKRQAELEDEVVRLNLEVARQVSTTSTLMNQYNILERKLLRLEEAFTGLRMKVSGMERAVSTDSFPRYSVARVFSEPSPEDSYSSTYYGNGRSIVPTDMADLRDRLTSTTSRRPVSTFFDDSLPLRGTASRTPEGVMYTDSISGATTVSPWSWSGPCDE